MLNKLFEFGPKYEKETTNRPNPDEILKESASISLLRGSQTESSLVGLFSFHFRLIELKSEIAGQLRYIAQQNAFLSSLAAKQTAPHPTRFYS